ncbi:hypothetical protein CONCODRAFT_4875 [Conidiobolus coronatus NRRL 28638]|uniref:Uncharacterized protein n=1 Tax=Conidiobolus coronatus (strain ATCC 28846 / CBS 209.66 / NRRL 28638) TaxID=796925 RepID=A0A137PBH2_CONC2|nr:hypothetical protein CONCODRAFT_4875 [Conidiobolus coronatus NRRL 28638]|eukprot:KXN72334.1 hypothetical protein CONCODRAFT_4875 [Conidiobolus coronatus NRRL 28638]
MRFSFSTILNDPSNFFDFTQFPVIKFSTKVTLVVYNPNYIPIPFVSSVKAYLGQNPTLFGTAEVPGAILAPRAISRVVFDLATTTNLLEPKQLNAIQVADVCGLFQTGSRNIINGKVHAMTSLGWFGWGIPLKNIIIDDVTLFCPMLQANFGEVILKIIDDLMPYAEQFTGVRNDEEMKDRLEYYRF